jgi:geranylgeranyl pyrophosphate synthase
VSASDFDLSSYLTDARSWADESLSRLLPSDEGRAGPGEADPGKLIEAMRYAVLSGGKRMRPAIALAACEAAGGRREQAVAGACAVELIHAYSLVHDDLPAMDDDDERRGQPTVHIRYGESNAILVGDALLTHAFYVLATAEALDASQRAASIACLARHAGVFGMVGGQARDLALGQAIEDLEVLERVHAEKTGGLYAAAAAMGAIAAGAEDAVVEALESYGRDFGVAFQHADDVLDDEQTVLRGEAAERLEALAGACRDRAARFGDAGRALAAAADWVLLRGRPG